MARKRLMGFALIMALVVLSAGCSSYFGGAKSGTLAMHMTDAPVDGAEEVNVTISEIQVHKTGGGWVTVVDTPQTYDILTLRAAETLLGQKTLTPGKYTQIRLVVSEANIVIDGERHNLTIPSGEVRLVQPFTISEDAITSLLLDFDARESVVETGGTYQLHPTIRVVDKVVSGTISGTVAPADSGALVSVQQNGEEVVSVAIDSTDGSFRINALPEGTYTLVISAAGYNDHTVENVTVTAQQNTDVGVITLTQAQ